MKRKVLKTIHDAAKGLTAAGVMDKKTKREFDALCLPPIKQLTKEEIRNIRQRENASQAEFAFYLNITRSTVQSWEQGDTRPNGPALKLLSIVEKKGLAFLAVD